jgi:hypothetical protein
MMRADLMSKRVFIFNHISPSFAGLASISRYAISKYGLLAGIVALLTSCASMPGGGDGSLGALWDAVKPKPPHYGLNKQSYGPLASYRDQATHAPVNPPHCDPEFNADENTTELARQLTAVIAAPIQGTAAGRPDDPIATEELQHHFKFYGDPSGNPPVAILDRSRDGIVFWHDGELVILEEVANAAAEFCKRKKRVAVYEGSARKCTEPQLMPVSINGKKTMISTYVITSFRCRS